MSDENQNKPTKSELPNGDYALAAKLEESGEIYRAALMYSCCLGYEDARERCRRLWIRIKRGNQGNIACRKHIIAVRSDGTVVTTDRDNGRVTRRWTDITAVAAGNGWFAGIRGDGTVVVTDKSLNNAVADWTGIVQIAAGLHHIVGRKNNGTVLAAGDNSYGQCDVEEWEYIEEIAAGDEHTVGMTGWGTVCAVGNNSDGRCNVGGSDGAWSGVTAIACGCDHTVTVDGEGRMELVGGGEYGDRECDDRKYGDRGCGEIAAVYGGSGTLGITLGGRAFCAGLCSQVVQQHKYEKVFSDWEWGIEDYGMDRKNINAAYDVSEWQGIVAMASGRAVTVGLCVDGTVKAAFAKPCGYPGRSAYYEEPAFTVEDIADWKDIRVTN